MTHVSKVAKGLACSCVCVACNTRLVRREGSRRAHFAHHKKGECRNAQETALHWAAKEILEETRRLLLPPVEYAESGKILKSHGARLLEFDAVELEVFLGSIIPDVIVTTKDRKLLVEFRVTHRCSEEKISRIRARALPTLEIDLSKTPRNANRKEIEEALVKSAPRSWLYNPKLEALIERVEEEKRNERKREAERIARLVANVRDAKAARAATNKKWMSAVRSVQAEGMNRYVNIEIDGDYCFAVPRQQWQAAIFSNFVLSPAQRFGKAAYRIDQKQIREWVRSQRLLRPPFERWIEDEDVEAIRKQVADFQPWFHVLSDYLSELEDGGILLFTHSDYRLSHSFIEPFQARLSRRQRQRETEERIKELAIAIGTRVPEGDRAGFDTDKWYDSAANEFGVSFRQSVDADDSRLESMMDVLNRVHRMICLDGEIVDHSLGLPIQSRRRQLTELRDVREQQQEEAKERTRRRAELERIDFIETNAREHLGLEAETWLGAPLLGQGHRTPRILAKSGPEGLHVAVVALKEIRAARHAQRQAEANRRKEADATKARLKQAVEDQVQRGKIQLAKAELFLSSVNPLTGRKRPLEYCVNDATLQVCLEAFEKVIGR